MGKEANVNLVENISNSGQVYKYDPKAPVELTVIKDGVTYKGNDPEVRAMMTKDKGFKKTFEQAVDEFRNDFDIDLVNDRRSYKLETDGLTIKLDGPAKATGEYAFLRGRTKEDYSYHLQYMNGEYNLMEYSPTVENNRTIYCDQYNIQNPFLAAMLYAGRVHGMEKEPKIEKTAFAAYRDTYQKALDMAGIDGKSDLMKKLYMEAELWRMGVLPHKLEETEHHEYQDGPAPDEKTIDTRFDIKMDYDLVVMRMIPEKEKALIFYPEQRVPEKSTELTQKKRFSDYWGIEEVSIEGKGRFTNTVDSRAVDFYEEYNATIDGPYKIEGYNDGDVKDRNPYSIALDFIGSYKKLLGRDLTAAEEKELKTELHKAIEAKKERDLDGRTKESKQGRDLERRDIEAARREIDIYRNWSPDRSRLVLDIATDNGEKAEKLEKILPVVEERKVSRDGQEYFVNINEFIMLSNYEHNFSKMMEEVYSRLGQQTGELEFGTTKIKDGKEVASYKTDRSPIFAMRPIRRMGGRAGIRDSFDYYPNPQDLGDGYETGPMYTNAISIIRNEAGTEVKVEVTDNSRKDKTTSKTYDNIYIAINDYMDQWADLHEDYSNYMDYPKEFENISRAEYFAEEREKQMKKASELMPTSMIDMPEKTRIALYRDAKKKLGERAHLWIEAMNPEQGKVRSRQNNHIKGGSNVKVKDTRNK